MACCNSNFSSTVYNIPDCNVACLDSAEPGSIFIGADGSIWILTGDDPCNPGNWETQDCCIRFWNDTGFDDVCCNELVNFTSDDDSVTITITDGKIDFSVTGLKLPLPVANYTYTTSALSGTLDGQSSSSTQDGTNITYAWSATGPGTMIIDNPTGVSPNFTTDIPGEYVVTLTVTDDNGNTSTIVETICVPAKDDCDTIFEIPSTAFANPNSPTDAEAQAWINTTGPYNCNTVFWFGGTELAPNIVWIYR